MDPLHFYGKESEEVNKPSTQNDKQQYQGRIYTQNAFINKFLLFFKKLINNLFAFGTKLIEKLQSCFKNKKVEKYPSTKTEKTSSEETSTKIQNNIKDFEKSADKLNPDEKDLDKPFDKKEFELNIEEKSITKAAQTASDKPPSLNIKNIAISEEDPIQTNTDKIEVKLNPDEKDLNKPFDKKEIELNTEEKSTTEAAQTASDKAPTLNIKNTAISEENPIQTNKDCPQQEREMIFQGMLNRMSKHFGINTDLLNLEEKEVLKDFVQIWSSHKELDKLEWQVNELAALLQISEASLDDFLYRIQFFHHSNLPLYKDDLNWLFLTLGNNLKNQFRIDFTIPGKQIWNCQTYFGDKNFKNRNRKGIDTPSWSLENLSMFLAKSQNHLETFLKHQNVKPDKDGLYVAKDIDIAINQASNHDINTLFEQYKNQSGSIRFSSVG